MRRLALVLLLLPLVLTLNGCSSSSGGGSGVTVTLSPSAPQTLDAGLTIAFTGNDSNNAGVNFSISGAGCTGAACGTLTNVTTTSVTYNAPLFVTANLSVNVVATSRTNMTTSASTAVTVVPNPNIVVTLSPSTAQSIDAGQTIPFTATVSGDPAMQGVNFIATGTNCTGNACGTFTNVTATTATYNGPTAISSNLAVTVTVTAMSNPGISQSTGVTVYPSPIIPQQNLPTGTVQTPYTEPNGDPVIVQATGGQGNLSFTISSGLLPAGLSLSTDGTISGIPTTQGTSQFVVKVTDQANPPESATAQLSITINASGFRIVNTTLPSDPVDVFYAAELQTVGGESRFRSASPRACCRRDWR